MKNFHLLYQSGKTVFDYPSLTLILGIDNRESLKSFIKRAVKQGLLQKIENGVYGLGKYNILEFASMDRKNSYISLETVLQKAGIIFQDYSGVITLISDNSMEKSLNTGILRFSKIKDSILMNPIGIDYTGIYSIASPERAICDRLYLTKDYSFDNLNSLDREKLEEIAKIYPKTTQKSIQKLIQHATNH